MLCLWGRLGPSKTRRRGMNTRSKFAFVIFAVGIFVQAPMVFAGDDEMTKQKRALCDEGNSAACFAMGERYRVVEQTTVNNLFHQIA